MMFSFCMFSLALWGLTFPAYKGDAPQGNARSFLIPSDERLLKHMGGPRLRFPNQVKMTTVVMTQALQISH